jgi:CRISPR-associated exonuclease Cas4
VDPLVKRQEIEARWPEDEYVLLSALQHLIFCERQFALIHVEQVWTENVLTVEGRHLHEQVDGGVKETRGDLRLARSVPLRCIRLGLVGKADAVEFRRDGNGVAIPGWCGRWTPFPVEYKRGRPKIHRADEVQLCAQGLCLEEMLGVEIRRGALFYGKTRRRKEVEFDSGLRKLVERAALRVHDLLERRQTPLAKREPKCDSCSLLEICRPETLSRSAQRFLDSALRATIASNHAGASD